jgi:trigger factor
MRELPELDDAFARSLGDFRGVEDLKRRVRQDLEEEAREAADALLRSRLLDAVLEANPFEVPRSLVERQIDAVLGDTRAADPDTVARARAELAGEAEAAVKRRLLVERIADSEGLSATPDEVKARVEAIAQVGGVTTDQVWTRLHRTNRMEALVQDVTEGKVAAFLTARTEIVEKPDQTAQNRT